MSFKRATATRLKEKHERKRKKSSVDKFSPIKHKYNGTFSGNPIPYSPTLVSNAIKPKDGQNQAKKGRSEQLKYKKLKNVFTLFFPNNMKLYFALKILNIDRRFVDMYAMQVYCSGSCKRTDDSDS